MRIVEFYSHLNGFEWLTVRRPTFWTEIEQTITTISAVACKTKVSKEKGKLGQLKYSPPALNTAFKRQLEALGWQESKVNYWVTDDPKLIRDNLFLHPKQQRANIQSKGKKPIFSFNQTDFVKDRVAIEVQFGKYSFIAYDLFVKHMAFFVGDQIDCGIEILPMKSMQAQMSSGPGYYEGALYDLVRQGRGVPAVPLILVGIAE